MSNFGRKFDAEWLAISGEPFCQWGQNFVPPFGFCPFCPLYGGLVLAKATSLCSERDLDIEQNGQNQNHQDFSVRLLRLDEFSGENFLPMIW